ncbi:hypothetical protein HCA61_22845 [Rhodococcus sp. HNM0563]|uniref:hypothetical protein n=1 Tax=Rhodococcus sp. HNM0563 TaxID=2716339 RepID=UPI00146F48ED|nr:hypothetical protein [Rhodococcus sp. HNM0563]NLU65077.1 hypothetical protein [Rhodococcus sp. HNM0563]
MRGLDIAGAVVAIDAMRMQRRPPGGLPELCRAEYVMVVKANQLGLLDLVRGQPWEQVPVVWSDPVERDHGREDQRGYKILRGLVVCDFLMLGGRAIQIIRR